MATLTAQILIGTGHPNDDGIQHTHSLFLSEGNRPGWVLLPENMINEQSRQKKKVWIPASVDTFLEDGLLMIALFVIKDKAVIKYVKERYKGPLFKLNHVEDLTVEDRLHLYELCRTSKIHYKLIISIFFQSSLQGDLHKLANYDMDVEVLTPVYTRLYSGWTGRQDEQGILTESMRRL
jgi:hypothetical protein